MEKQIKEKFIEIFSEVPVVISSPGRINLIGEHTDYNNGFVLPAAIDKQIWFALSKREDAIVKIYSFDMNDFIEINTNLIKKNGKGWANYLLGVLNQLKIEGYDITGFNCVFGGNIPIGAGLSSSAAIEAGLTFGLNYLFNLNIDNLSMVKISQKAENDFVGVQCGIMDQFINIYGEDKHVLKLDCRTLEYQPYPFDYNDYLFLLCDTKVKHSLAASEYNLRREECERGVNYLKRFDPKIKSLRDTTKDFLEAHKEDLESVIYKRCEYVLEENERVLLACENLEQNDLESFGEKMFQSHSGLKEKYEVSCSELDTLVEIAKKQEGVLGARMMGGGFGGCTINLVKKSYVKEFSTKVITEYKKIYNIEPDIILCEISGGSKVI